MTQPRWHRGPLAALALLIAAALIGATPAHAQPDQRCFPETGQCIAGRIRQFWEQNGGLPVFGLPLSPQRAETIEGKSIQAQWFERNRLELHPENQRPYDVLIGRVGADVLAKQGRDWNTFPKPGPATPADNPCRTFAETGQRVCGEFLRAFQLYGLDLGRPGTTYEESLALFGLPLSAPMTETLEGSQYQVQWFERARFELHPELKSRIRILFGRLGAELQSGQPLAPSPLADTAWQLTSYGAASQQQPAVAASPATLRFGADGRASGSTGCNGFSGSYTVAGNQITFGPIAATLKACPEPLNGQEREVLAALAGTVRFEAAAGVLKIFYKGEQSALVFAQALAGSNIVAIDSGKLQGASADGVQSFKGIPYAAPPVGNLRWRAPQPVSPWNNVRPATAFGSDCMQLQTDFERIQTTPSEDCLFVNVWRPAEIAPNAKLPVLVWIHGGGWVGGGSSIPWYDGSAFARKGLVVVSLNYRLARFGFFAHPALLKAQEGPVGNFGYMDQIAALNWVQRNAAAFGGDPRAVTLMGESAGGAGVLALLTSPLTKGLFQRVVVLSGGGRKGLALRQMTGGSATNPSADQLDAKFAQTAGVGGDDAKALAALRALPAETVRGNFSLATVALAAIRDGIFEGTHMIDGTTVTDTPGNILANGQVPNVPMIIGTTAEEFPLTFPPKTDPFSYFGPDADAARAAYNAPATLDPQNILPLLMQISMDITMNEPARNTAKQMVGRGNNVWLYRFTYTAEATRPKAQEQSHAGELPFLFNQLAARYGGAVTSKDQKAADAFNTYIANFAKGGDPNSGSLPAWKKFDPARFDLLNFTLDDGPLYTADPRAQRVELVERAASR